MPAASRAMSPSLIDTLRPLPRTNPPSSSRSGRPVFAEQTGCDPERLLAHALCGNVHGVARVDGLPAGEPAVPHRHMGGVAGDHVDFGGRDAELLGGDLGQHGGGALPHRGGAGIDRNPARPADAHDAGFERPAPGALHRLGDADADDSAPAPAPRPCARQSRHSRIASRAIAWHLGKSPLSYLTGVPARVFSGVVYGIAAAGIEIAPPNLGPVEPDAGRRRDRAAARWRTRPADSRRRGPAWWAPCWSRPRPLSIS